MYTKDKRAFIALSEDGRDELCLTPGMANRHGLITGATGTGKTVTLQTMAETFSAMGVPVFAADVKGDLSGVAGKGGNKESVVRRVEDWRLAKRGFAFQAFPVQFWDVFGEQGAPVRASVADMGPLLLSRLLALNDTQSAVLTLVFKIAKDEGLELVDLKDTQKILEYVGNNAARFTAGYGNISTASVGAIQRGMIALEQEGAERFFGEPALVIDDLIQIDGGRGVINILAADRLVNSPRVYATFLLWLMTKLFETLPEMGDQDRPKLVFFFDEAHLLFNDAPKALVEKVEQVARLIRSKGVGLYFISQTPSDIPDSVLSQLGNRVQHALRAYTPKDQKAVRAAAQSFRASPGLDVEKAISELGIGEALVSFLDAKGAPQPAARAFILPPEGQIGPLDAALRANMTKGTLLYRHYALTQDRNTAYEKLNERLRGAASFKEQAAADKRAERDAEKARKEKEKARLMAEREAARNAREQRRFWGSAAKLALAPIVRRIITSLFK
ncbi:ATP-binding protein [Alphaproteobacteria bacterium]|nr:ATP-binding protein [Alphaproteobacteria bacterium]